MNKNFNKLEFIFISIICNHFVNNNDSITKKIFKTITNISNYKLRNLKYIKYFFFNIEYYLKEYQKISYSKYYSKYNFIDYLNKNSFNTTQLKTILKKDYLNISDFGYLYELSKTTIANDYFLNINKLKHKRNSALCKAIVEKNRPIIKDFYIKKEDKQILFGEGNQIKNFKVLTF